MQRRTFTDNIINLGFDEGDKNNIASIAPYETSNLLPLWNSLGVEYTIKFVGKRLTNYLREMQNRYPNSTVSYNKNNKTFTVTDKIGNTITISYNLLSKKYNLVSKSGLLTTTKTYQLSKIEINTAEKQKLTSFVSNDGSSLTINLNDEIKIEGEIKNDKNKYNFNPTSFSSKSYAGRVKDYIRNGEGKMFVKLTQKEFLTLSQSFSTSMDKKPLASEALTINGTFENGRFKKESKIEVTLNGVKIEGIECNADGVLSFSKNIVDTVTYKVDKVTYAKLLEILNKIHSPQIKKSQIIINNSSLSATQNILSATQNLQQTKQLNLSNHSPREISQRSFEHNTNDIGKLDEFGGTVISNIEPNPNNEFGATGSFVTDLFNTSRNDKDGNKEKLNFNNLVFNPIHPIQEQSEESKGSSEKSKDSSGNEEQNDSKIEYRLPLNTDENLEGTKRNLLESQTKSSKLFR